MSAQWSTTPAATSAATAAQVMPRGALAAYALFALPLMMTALPINILLPKFYSETTGLRLDVIGYVFLASRLVDAIADPLLGTWIDAQKSRGAYLRPILIAAPIMALGFVLLFTPPASSSEAAAAVWLAVTLVAAYLGYSLAIVAYQAWGAELAHDDTGRTRITAAREGAGLIGVLIGGSLPALAGTPALLAVFVALLGVAVWTLAARAPRAAPAALAATHQGNPYLRFLVPLGTSRFRWLLLVFACNALAPAITATVFQFFVADGLGLSEQQSALALATYFIAGAASMPLWARLASRWSLHAVWLAGMLAAIAAFIWAYALGAGDLAGFLVICVLSGLAFGADLAIPPALLARVIDANGHQGAREGAYFGLWHFANKLTLALAGGIALPMLAAFGYSSGARDAAALDALALVYAVLPCALKLVAVAVLAAAWKQNRF
jgi:Na+/melibiose symporter-like transporter